MIIFIKVIIYYGARIFNDFYVYIRVLRSKLRREIFYGTSQTKNNWNTK